MQLDVFHSLADPTRRRIVEVLHDEQAVNDIVALVGIHQSGVSRHLRILHEAGFVQVRPGAERMYSLRPEPFYQLDRLGWWTPTGTSGKPDSNVFAAALERCGDDRTTTNHWRKHEQNATSKDGPRRTITIERDLPARSRLCGICGPPTLASNPGGARTDSRHRPHLDLRAGGEFPSLHHDRDRPRSKSNS